MNNPKPYLHNAHYEYGENHLAFTRYHLETKIRTDDRRSDGPIDGQPTWYHNTITKTCLYNIDLLKPHFYIVKLGFTGVYIIFLISAQKHRLWVLVRTASRNMKNIRMFYLKNCHFLVVKFSVYLNRRVFVMLATIVWRGIKRAVISFEQKNVHNYWLTA